MLVIILVFKCPPQSQSRSNNNNQKSFQFNVVILQCHSIALKTFVNNVWFSYEFFSNVKFQFPILICVKYRNLQFPKLARKQCFLKMGIIEQPCRRCSQNRSFFFCKTNTPIPYARINTSETRCEFVIMS